MSSEERRLLNPDEVDARKSPESSVGLPCSSAPPSLNPSSLPTISLPPNLPPRSRPSQSTPLIGPKPSVPQQQQQQHEQQTYQLQEPQINIY